MKTMAFETVGQTIVLYHSEDKPADEEWDAYVEAIRSAPQGMNTLVWTEGGGPNVNQRKRVTEALDSRSDEVTLVAVLSHDMWTRGVITAFKWLGVNIAAFRRAELTEAMAYLGLLPASKDRIEEALSRLKSSVQSG